MFRARCLDTHRYRNSVSCESTKERRRDFLQSLFRYSDTLWRVFRRTKSAKGKRGSPAHAPSTQSPDTHQSQNHSEKNLFFRLSRLGENENRGLVTRPFCGWTRFKYASENRKRERYETGLHSLDIRVSFSRLERVTRKRRFFVCLRDEIE